jgi:hypothetical protein
MRNLFASLICVSLLLAGCGGSGGGTATTSSSGSSSSGSSGSSSSGSSGSSGTGGTPGHNVANAIVDQGPAALNNAGFAAANIMYVNVTICAPGSTTNCQTIDHVQVDTGSQGVRILSSALTNTSLLSALQPVTASGEAVAECTQFVDGYSWGPLVTADVHIGGADTATTGESAPGIPVQIIGSSTYPVPTSCANNSSNTTSEDTVATFGANGIIGIGLFDYDCGTGCTSAASYASYGLYYTCPTASSCALAPVPESSQAVNPVFKLAANDGVTDNNGAIIELPAVGASGAATVAGTLVFGIGTQSNNALAASATVLTTDPYYGYVTTAFNGQTDTTSYLDSGSNAIYFDDSNIVNCTDNSFFCPASIEDFKATITGTNTQAVGVPFSIANADTLFNSNDAAFSNLGGSASTAGTSGVGTFAWGLPFYYGQNVYTAMENMNAGGTDGPYFAF